MYPVEGAQNSLVHCDSTLMWLESCLPSTPDTLLTPHTHTHTYHLHILGHCSFSLHLIIYSTVHHPFLYLISTYRYSSRGETLVPLSPLPIPNLNL